MKREELPEPVEAKDNDTEDGQNWDLKQDMGYLQKGIDDEYKVH